MHTAAEFRSLAMAKKKQARDYRRDARMSRPERKAMLMKWAVECDEHSAFYASRAQILDAVAAETHEVAA